MGWLWVSSRSIAISTLLTTKEKEEVGVCDGVPPSECACECVCDTQLIYGK